MNDVMVDPKAQRAQRNGDRLLLGIYIMTDGRREIAVSRHEISEFVKKHRLFQMTDEEFEIWKSVHVMPVYERAQQRKPQA